MSWYSTNFKKRIAFTVEDSGGLDQMEIDLAEHKTLDDFWDNIDASGEELRMVDPSGLVELDYQLISFSKANRTGTIRVEGFDFSSNNQTMIWLYHDTVSAAGDGSTTVSSSNPGPGYAYTGRPNRIVRNFTQRPGSTRPRSSISKGSDESIVVWFDLTDLLIRSVRPYNNRTIWEEPAGVKAQIFNSAGAAQSAMIDKTRTLFVALRDRVAVTFWITGGTDGDDYTIAPEIYTVDGDNVYNLGGQVYRTLVPRVGLSVNDVLLS